MSPLNKEILRLALPSILANITVPLVSMADMAIAGHLDTSAAILIGGVSIGSMLFDLLYWSFSFLRSGTGGFTAQAWGRKDQKECADILCRAVGLSFLIAAFLLIIQWPFAKTAMLLVDSSDSVVELAYKYFFIRIWAAPATLSLFAFKGWFIGMQDSVSSMAVDLVVNCTNIIASVLFALKIGYIGIPIGTIVAQYTGLILSLGIIFFKYRKTTFVGYTFKDMSSSFKISAMRDFMNVNGDLFIRSISLVVIYIGFTMISSRYGDTLLAVSSILMKLLLLFSYFTDGFAFAGEALTGRFVGSKDRVNLKHTVRLTFVWSMSIGLTFVFIYALCGIPMFRVMTSDVSVVEAARPFVFWLVIMPLFGCPAFTWDGIFTGATASKPMKMSCFWSMVGFFVVYIVGGIILKTSGLTGDSFNIAAVHVLLGAYFMHLFVRVVYQSFKYKSSVLVKVQ